VHRVLLTAYACEPGRGSEEGIGWNWVRQVSRRHDCWLVTRSNNVERIRQAAAEQGLTRLTVIGFDLPRWARFWKRGSRGAVAYFYLWQLALVPLARRLDAIHNFEITQHLTFASSWIPSGLAFLDKPFVWGPVGQHPRIPQFVAKRAGFRLRLNELGKSVVKQLLGTIDPFVRLTMRRADVVLSIGSEFEERHGSRLLRPPVRLPACGVERVRERAAVSHGRRVAFAGRLVELKGPELALRAFAKVAHSLPDAHLTFIGTGPLEAKLAAIAERVGLQDRVTFTGRLPHEGVLEELCGVDVFLFPSFEGAGMVVPEAMACGAAVVCLDFGGPGDMTEGQRGLRVGLGRDFDSTVDNLGIALEQILTDHVMRQEHCARARQWIATEMTWDQKGQRLDAIYDRVLRDRISESGPTT
jgi:glycosyltransferase involved in cell wall biosynthesis